MTRAVSLVLALTLSGAPAANIACAAWCDAHAGGKGIPWDLCHSEMAQSFFGVSARSDACEVFASTPCIREDPRKMRPAALAINVALPPAAISVAGTCVNGGVPVEGQRVLPNHARRVVLRV